MMTDSFKPIAPGLLLPERSRLIHIGMPKSGSSAIQGAANASRAALAEHGVLYPGKDINHIQAAAWLTDSPLQYLPNPGPHRHWWNLIKSEIDAETDKRVLFSYEGVCRTDIVGARRTVENIGSPSHGLLVLRRLGSFAPSVWQQNVKSGRTRKYHDFLRKVFKSADPSAAISPAFHHLDGYSLVERWAEVLGPENLTVVVLEKSEPDRLLATIEQMLGLPDRLLLDVPVPPAGVNRSLTAVEAAVLVHLNRRLLNDWGASKTEHRRLVFNGSVARLVKARTPAPEEERIGTPQWALDATAEIGQKIADDVRTSGVRVIGDLDELGKIGKAVEREPSDLPANVPSDIAIEALAGMFASATGLDHSHNRQTPIRPKPSQR